MTAIASTEDRTRHSCSFGQVYEQVADTTAKMVGPYRGIVKAAGKIMGSLPKALKASTDIAQGLTLLTVPLTAASLVKNIQKATGQKTSLKDRVISTLKGVSDTAELVDGAAKVCTLLSVARLVSDKITCWIPVFEWVNFFVRFISLGFSVKENVEIGKMAKTLQNDLNKVRALGEDGPKREKLIAMLDSLAQKDMKSLEKDFDISRRADLKGRIDSLRARLLCKEDSTSVEDTQKFFQIFKKRVSTRLGFSIAGTVNKVVGIVGGAFLFTPLSLVGVIILAISSCVNFSLTYSRKLFLSRNPFDEKEPLNIVRQAGLVKERVSRIAHSAMHGMKSACQRVQENCSRILCPRQVALAHA